MAQKAKSIRGGEPGNYRTGEQDLNTLDDWENIFKVLYCELSLTSFKLFLLNREFLTIHKSCIDFILYYYLFIKLI